MKSMTEFKKLGPHLSRPLFRTSEANELGVSTSLLAYYIKLGFVERVARGVYRGAGVTPNVDFMWEDLVTTINSIPSGVICLSSALSIYELTDEIPRKHWIAIPNSTTAPKRKNIKAVRMRDIKTEVKVISLGEEKVKIFSIERTLVDAFRFLSKEIAIKALRSAVKGDKKIDFKKLQSTAKKLRVDINPYLMTVTT